MMNRNLIVCFLLSVLVFGCRKKTEEIDPPLTGVIVSTFAGNGNAAIKDGQGAGASFFGPVGIAVAVGGDLFISDTQGNVIRKITPAGAVTTYAGTGDHGAGNGEAKSSTFWSPGGMALDIFGNLYVADFYNNMIRKITPGGVVSTVAGTGELGQTDGPGDVATFGLPSGVVVDRAGNLFVTELSNNLVRKITPAGVVSTFAGNLDAGQANGPGASASFNGPFGLAIDAADNLYIADTGNNVVRKITPDGVVSTYAGTGTSGLKDGPAATATFQGPKGLTIDNNGDIFVSDSFNNKIRKISAEGMVTTYAGNGQPGSKDGAGPVANFHDPIGLGLNLIGELYVADYTNEVIRKIIFK